MAMEIDYESIIIEKSKLGDEQAWSILFKQNFKSVYHFCVQLLHGRENEAEDLTQQVFMIAAKNIHKYASGEGTFRVWLFGITKNCLKKHLSKMKSNKQTDSACFESLAEPAKCSSNLLVLETLAHLPAHYSMIIEAKYLDKKTINQIAQAQNTTEMAAESMLTRAKEKFRQVYIQLKKQEYQV